MAPGAAVKGLTAEFLVAAAANWRSVFDKTVGTRDSEKPAMNDHMISNARLSEGSINLLGHLGSSA